MLTAIIITSVIFMALIICLLMASKDWDILGKEYEVELENRRAAMTPEERQFILEQIESQPEGWDGVDRRTS